MTLTRKFVTASALLALGFATTACNNHPLEPLDKVVTAANNTQVSIPAKTKLDFLFMIDNSGSMCEEQANLVSNFDKLSQFLFDELGDAADYRIAIINTDLRTPTSKGRFQDAPPPVMVNNCAAAGQQDAAECADFVGADGHWKFGPILKSGTQERGGNIGSTREDLERRFRCLAKLGTNGDGFEKGLESMRLALSCEGPNRQFFQQCCIDELNGQGQRTKSTYDRACAEKLPLGTEPDFLRPDAILVLVNLSDEVDCSDPASNPKASHRAICKYGFADGNDADTLPDGYQDPALCPERDAAACYARECGGLAPEDCYKARCEVSRGDNNNCEWFRDALTPVQDYVDFLRDLKVEPDKQLIVASIVGKRAFVQDPTSMANVEVYNQQGSPAPMCALLDNDGQPTKTSDVNWECCPEGRCTGGPAPTCESENGKAFSGRRYLELAEQFGINGIGCPADASSEDCVTICDDDFRRPLQTIKDKIAKLLGTYCLAKVPQCLAPDPTDPTAPLRPCQTEEERANLENYKPTIGVEMQCIHTIDTGGSCEAFMPLTRLPQDAFTVDESAACPTRLAVTLTDPPPAGAQVFLDFRVDVSEGAGLPGDASSPAPSGTDDGGIISPDGGVIIISGDSGTLFVPDAQQ